MAFLSSSRIQTLATSMEHELADYDLWIDEVRAQLRDMENNGSNEARDKRARGADLLAGLMRARNAIAAASEQVFNAQTRTHNVVNFRGRS